MTPASGSGTAHISVMRTPQSRYRIDRFIPLRVNRDFLWHSDCPIDNGSQSNPSTARSNAIHTAAMAKVLLSGQGVNARVFTFSKPTSHTSEHHQSELRRIYTQNKDNNRIQQVNMRHIMMRAERVLDAPNLCNDAHINLIDWSAANLLAVALGPSVFLWNGETHSVSRLCTLPNPNDLVTSIQFIQGGSHLAIGTSSLMNDVQLWSIETQQQLRSMRGHEARSGALAWNGTILSSGSRDRSIIHHDVRAPVHRIVQLRAHEGEVCSLKWNSESSQLASGSSDHQAMVWDVSSTSMSLTGCKPRLAFTHSRATVKALAWCPFRRNLLATGAGTADQHIRLYNTVNGLLLDAVSSESQVTSIQWSRTEHELLSSHGNPGNHLSVWKFPSLAKVADLVGHTSPVLHSAVSPDGGTVVSVSADETLRFWQVWNTMDTKTTSMHSVCNAHLSSSGSVTRQMSRQSLLASSIR